MARASSPINARVHAPRGAGWAAHTYPLSHPLRGGNTIAGHEEDLDPQAVEVLYQITGVISRRVQQSHKTDRLQVVVCDGKRAIALGGKLLGIGVEASSVYRQPGDYGRRTFLRGLPSPLLRIRHGSQRGNKFC